MSSHLRDQHLVSLHGRHNRNEERDADLSGAFQSGVSGGLGLWIADVIETKTIVPDNVPAVTLSGNLFVAGDLHANYMTISGDKQVGDDLDISGDLIVEGTTRVKGLSAETITLLSGDMSMDIQVNDATNDAYILTSGDQDITIGNTESVIRIGSNGEYTFSNIGGVGAGNTLSISTPGNAGHTGLTFNVAGLGDKSRFDMWNDSNAVEADRQFYMRFPNDPGLSVRKGGNVGIGLTLPTQQLDVNGNTLIRGTLDMNSSNRIINTADPISAQDVATKNYVDNAGGSVRLARLWDEGAATGGGGDNATSNVWQGRNFTNISQFGTSFCSLVGSNSFQLDAGTQTIHAEVPSYLTERYSLRLYNTTTSTAVLQGGTSYLTATQVGTGAVLIGFFTLASTSTLELQAYMTVSPNTNFEDGVDSSNSVVSIYTQMLLQKVA